MKQTQRCFLNGGDVEVEVCTSTNGKYFVRHHTYWYIVYEKKNPDPVYNCIIDNLKIMWLESRSLEELLTFPKQIIED